MFSKRRVIIYIIFLALSTLNPIQGFVPRDFVEYNYQFTKDDVSMVMVLNLEFFNIEQLLECNMMVVKMPDSQLLYTFFFDFANDKNIPHLLIHEILIPQDIWAMTIGLELTIMYEDEAYNVITIGGFYTIPVPRNLDALDPISSVLDEISSEPIISESPISDLSGYILPNLIIIIGIVISLLVRRWRLRLKPTYTQINLNKLDPEELAMVRRVIYSELKSITDWMKGKENGKFISKPNPVVEIQYRIQKKNKVLREKLRVFDVATIKMNGVEKKVDRKLLKNLSFSILEPYLEDLSEKYINAVLDHIILKNKRKELQSLEKQGMNSIEVEGEINLLNKDIKQMNIEPISVYMENLIVKETDQPDDSNVDRNFVSIDTLDRKVKICCYQTARLMENYCRCGLAIDEDLKSYFN